MITTHDIRQYDDAIATPLPRHIWIDGAEIHVYTGADIPPPPPVMPEMIERKVAIAAIKAAGKTDTEAATLLDGAKKAPVI